MIKAWFQQSFINSKKWALKYDRQWHLHESSPRPTFSLLFLFSIFLSAYGRQRFAEQIMLRTTIYRLSLLVDMLMMQYVARHCVLNNDAHPKLAMTSSYPRNFQQNNEQGLFAIEQQHRQQYLKNHHIQMERPTSAKRPFFRPIAKSNSGMWMASQKHRVVGRSLTIPTK